MRVVVAVVGLLIVLFTFVDILQTTIMSRGGGSVSDRLTSALWKVLIMRRKVMDKDRRLSQAGIVLMLLVIGIWVVLIWLGWSLVFWGAESALVNAQSKAPATFWDRVYFAGYTIVTLGLGDFQPQGTFWQLATVLMSFSGLSAITFSITYLIPVVQAATQRRTLAVHISGLGLSGEEILLGSWEDKQCKALEEHLVPLAPEIAMLAQRHLTYPVLHYFHGANRREALAPSIAALDEALTIIESSMEEGECVSKGVRLAVRTAITELLETLDERFIDPEEEPPPPPSLAGCRSNGFRVESDEVFCGALEKHAKRRSLLLAMVRREGWDWEDARSADDSEDDDKDTPEKEQIAVKHGAEKDRRSEGEK